MKKSFKVYALFLTSILLSCVYCNAADTPLGDHFVDATLRIDYYHIADKNTAIISLDKIYKQGIWAGNPESFIDEFNIGGYYHKIYDVETGKLIYSKGFNSYCGEYVTTTPAANGVKRTFHESALIPMPVKKFRFVMEKRDRTNQLSPIFQTEIDPNGIDINDETLTPGVEVFQLLKSGHPHKCVDLAIVAEGYTEAEKEKFIADAHQLVKTLKENEPYKTNIAKINVNAVFKASLESGPDQPLAKIYKNTALGSSFNSLGLKRYLLTDENRAMRDITAHTPYDAVIIITNSTRYGGGGIYNSFCIFTSSSRSASYIFLHELGHSLSGLADEYYTSNVTYNDFYAPGVEPLEPNITALLDPKNLKWKHLVAKDTPLPTPWDKQKYDNMKWGERTDFMKSGWEKFRNVVGAFEGAGYVSTGFYRPMFDCTMFDSCPHYCRVCEEAVIKVIDYYTK